MTEEYYTETYITEWKDKDNVIISLWHMNERDDTEQVGVVELAVYKHGEHDGEALVWNLYVDEDHRRNGLARKLMDEAHKTAKHLGAKVMALEWSLKESPYWVIEWYTRLGYDEKEIGNGCALMKRPLNIRNNLGLSYEKRQVKSDWREKCCDQCKYKFVEYKGTQHQCGFSKCTDEEVAEFNEHNGCQGIREYLETGNFPERARK